MPSFTVKYHGVIIDKRLIFNKQVDYIRLKNCQEDEFTQNTEFTIGRKRKNYKEYLHSNYTINIGVRSSYLRNDGP